MTLVGLLLELPVDGGDDRLEVPCQGVVVRCRVLDVADESRFETAIFFQDLDPDAREALDSFLSRKISPPAG
jgi:hypothetical protein